MKIVIFSGTTEGRALSHLLAVRLGRPWQGDTLRYLKLLGRVNCALAAMADNVCEVVYGIPVYYKGGEPV